MKRFLKWLKKELVIPDGYGMRDELRVEQWRNGKKIVDKTYIGKCPTNLGFKMVADLVGDITSVAAVTYLALGTDATAATAAQTALLGEVGDSGLERHAATVTAATTTQTDDTLQLLWEWTATGIKVLREIGAFNDASVGTMLARKVYDELTTAATDHVKMTYKFPFSAL